MSETNIHKSLAYIAVICLSFTTILSIYLQLNEGFSIDTILTHDQYVPKEYNYYSDLRQAVYLKKQAIWLKTYCEWLSLFGIFILLFLFQHFEYKKKWLWWILIMNLISINIFSDIIDTLSACLVLYLLYKFKEFNN